MTLIDLLTVWLVVAILHLFFASLFNENFLSNIGTFAYLHLMNLFFVFILYFYLKIKDKQL